MTVRDFLSDRLERFVLWTLFAVTAGLFLLLTGTGAGIIILLCIAYFFAVFCVQAAEFFRCRSRLQELENILDGLDEKYLFFECVPGAGNSYERRLLDLSKKAGRSMIGTVSDAQAAQREYREYVESWVHEIKAPITAAELICRSAAPEMRRKLSRELSQIEAHVERALFYARAETPEKDLIVRQVSLLPIARQAIDNHRSLLIKNDIRIEIKNLEQTVYTDEKWVVFILGQLLQNAARYRSDDPVIVMSAGQIGEQVQLFVRDNGIGILSHELPRVFDRGYTGSNGRSRGGSTGMGLYLCRKLADCLEIDLQITSEAGKGTTVVLTFPAGGNLTKL